MKSKLSGQNSKSEITNNPLQTEYLIGRDQEYNFLFNGLVNKKLHHSVCLSGPRGIGKMTTICKVIKDVFTFFEKQTSTNFNSAKMIADNIHPDVLILQHSTDSAKKEISIDQIRNLIEFAFLKPSCFNFKIIIIDSLDDLNTNSSNALLKILEEPAEGTYFLTTYHTDREILKTIRSRCITTYCSPLTEANFIHVLKNYLPQVDEAEMQKLCLITKSNASMAINMHLSNGIEGYEMLIKDLINGTSLCLLFFKKIEDLNLNRNSFFHLFITRILSHLLHFSCGIKSNILFDEEMALLNWAQQHFISPLEIIEKTKRVMAITSLSETYGASFPHMLLTILSILKSDRTTFSDVNKIYN